jgi:hypothetical protein
LVLLGFTGISGSATDRIGGVALTQAQHLSTGGLRNPII